MRKLYIIKIGGNIIDDEAKLGQFLQSFSKIAGPKILVHGGGKIATTIGKKLGIVPQMVDGRRLTDAETLKIVTMVYGGLINKNIVAKLQSFECNAIGLTGADANVLPAHKREVKEIDYGYVGDIEDNKINSQILVSFLDNGLSPVMAPLTHDGNGNMLNTNADTIASALAVSLSSDFEVSLMYCFEKAGVLKDVNDENSLIESISTEEYEDLKVQHLIHDGMIPKLDNAFDAIKKGVKSVHIVHADAIENLTDDKKIRGTELSL